MYPLAYITILGHLNKSCIVSLGPWLHYIWVETDYWFLFGNSYNCKSHILMYGVTSIFQLHQEEKVVLLVQDKTLGAIKVEFSGRGQENSSCCPWMLCLLPTFLSIYYARPCRSGQDFLSIIQAFSSLERKTLLCMAVFFVKLSSLTFSYHWTS